MTTNVNDINVIYLYNILKSLQNVDKLSLLINIAIVGVIYLSVSRSTFIPTIRTYTNF